MFAEQAYPGLFLPLTRENARKIAEDPDFNVEYVAYPYKKAQMADDEFITLNVGLTHKLSQHFIAFGSNKGIGAATMELAPKLDFSTSSF